GSPTRSAPRLRATSEMSEGTARRTTAPWSSPERRCRLDSGCPCATSWCRLHESPYRPRYPVEPVGSLAYNTAARLLGGVARTASTVVASPHGTRSRGESECDALLRDAVRDDPPEPARRRADPARSATTGSDVAPGSDRDADGGALPLRAGARGAETVWRGDRRPPRHRCSGYPEIRLRYRRSGCAAADRWPVPVTTVQDGDAEGVAVAVRACCHGVPADC